MIWKKPMEVLSASRIWMIAGNYGSGKTELSLNLALEFVKTGPTLLVDVDIVNPYFRSAEHEEMLSQAGIELMMPTFAMTTVDIPALPAEISAAFERGHQRVLFDVGGDDTGATALGRYKPQVDASGAKMLFVLNAMRPLTRDAESVVDLIHRIQNKARVQVSALINNTNMGRETQPEDVLKGRGIAESVAEKLGIDSAFHTAHTDIFPLLPEDMREHTFGITPYTRPEWLD